MPAQDLFLEKNHLGCYTTPIFLLAHQTEMCQNDSMELDRGNTMQSSHRDTGLDYQTSQNTALYAC